MTNDVLLVPLVLEQPIVETQRDVVVFIPKATKDTYGVVKVGSGLLIDKDETLVLDVSLLDDLKVMLSDEIMNLAEDLSNHENRDDNPHNVTKEQIGLDKVNNTSDEEKPVSNATRNAIASVEDEIQEHIATITNPHKVTKEQIGLGRVDNTSDNDKPVSIATKRELLRLENMISGSRGALAFDSYEDMVSVLNSDTEKMYGLGQSIFIKTKKVPDLWIYSVSDESIQYEYTSDKAIIDALEQGANVQIGYYVLTELETNNITLDNVVTTDTPQNITADKNFKGALRFNGIDVATIDDINSVTLDSLSFQPAQGDIIYANNTAYYQGQFTYTSKKNGVPISVEGTLALPIVGDGVTISTDGDVLKIKAIIPEVDTSNLVTLDGIQNITGTKVFTEQIGILNGAEGEINYIKHINNNFLISASDGENIINIDEQLKTFNFYNKPLALEEYVDENFVSFTTQQMLTEEQKETVRNNIGAGTSSGPTIAVDSELSIDSENPVQNKVITAALNNVYTKDEVTSIVSGIEPGQSVEIVWWG